MWLFKLVSVTNFIAFIVGLIYYKRFSPELKTVFYFVVFGVLTESYTRFHLHFIMKNTMPIGHFYFPVAFLIMGLFYMQVLKDFIKPKYILTPIILFVTYCLINTLFIQSLFEYASLVGSIGAMILFLFSVAFFTKVMVEAKILKLSEEPLIWINTAVLIYYAANFFYHSLFNVRLNASLEIALLSVKIFAALNILFYLIIIIGFLKTKKVKQAKAK
ncbi:MAG: hypothetical protein FD181_2216 [Prolixibacteraceae bacterium]|nr:MAG: hypothetical protein FD181_2216 [Prolixibacteraceae bacterium]